MNELHHAMKFYGRQLHDLASAIVEALNAEAEESLEPIDSDPKPAGITITVDDGPVYSTLTIPCDPGTIDMVRCVRVKGEDTTTLELKVRHGQQDQ
jgi:hypothetical protein